MYFWKYLHEKLGNKGFNELASFVMDFISKKAENGVKEFFFYSDNCTGQNRNIIMYAMYSAMAEQHSITITHRFLEMGHTQNEGDAMHALVERRREGQTIFVSEQCVMVIRMAKSTDPKYVVKEVCTKDIKDCKALFEFDDHNWIFNESCGRVK